MKSNSNKSFKALVTKMQALQETEQGKLKGGVSSLGGPSTGTDLGGSTSNSAYVCVENAYQCGKKISK